MGSGGRPPVGIWGKAAAEVLRDEVPRSCNNLQKLFTDFDCRNDQNSKMWD